MIMCPFFQYICGNINFRDMACRASTIIFILNILMAGTVYDVDGNAYQTVQIGEQIWMAENLKNTHYNNGDIIQTGYDNTAWSNLTTGAYAVYDDDETYAANYGYLYNWYAAYDSLDICPEGWHVPTDAEFTILTDYLGGFSVAGGKMKETGLDHWDSPNTGATNESGFTGLPAGYRNGIDGSYSSMGNYGYFWSSSESSSNYAWSRTLNYYSSNVYQSNYYRHYGFSIRCMSDSGPVDCEEGAIPNCNPDFAG